MNCAMSLISVIVPIYNVESYLEKCIDSIINQSYKNLEVILVDDGSTDRSGEICNVYKEKDTRITVIHKQNGGLSSARNAGLNISKGEYVGFVDGDDYIAKDMYEVLHRHMGEDTDITCCGRLSISRNGRSTMYKSKGKITYCAENAIYEILKGDVLSFSVCDKLFRKNVIGDDRFLIGRTSEDIPFTYNVIKRSNKLINTGEVKYFYCYRPDSISHTDFSIRRMDCIYFLRDINRDVAMNYPRLKKVAEARYLIDISKMIWKIGNCPDKQRYLKEQKRLKKVLKHMFFRMVLNPYMKKEDKYMCIKRICGSRIGG